MDVCGRLQAIPLVPVLRVWCAKRQMRQNGYANDNIHSQRMYLSTIFCHSMTENKMRKKKQGDRQPQRQQTHTTT